MQEQTRRVHKAEMGLQREEFVTVRGQYRADAGIEIGNSSAAPLSQLNKAVHDGCLSQQITMKQAHEV